VYRRADFLWSLPSSAGHWYPDREKRTPPTARLRLLLVGGVSFASGFQFFSRLAWVQ
jgi:hypothetical protein